MDKLLGNEIFFLESYCLHLFLQADWEGLSKFKAQDMQASENRAELAVMIAIANAQLSNELECKSMITLAKKWGLSNATLAKYFSESVHLALKEINSVRISETKKVKDYVQRYLSPLVSGFSRYEHFSQVISKRDTKPLLHNRSTFRVNVISRHALGNAWAGNTINTVIFRHNGILTIKDYQFTAFYIDETTLRIVSNNLKTNNTHSYDLIGNYNLVDAHNSISLGVDRAGFIHICYDHHGSALNYRRSLKAYNITNWSDEIPMTGLNEDQLTYPTFIQPKAGNPLLLMYRDGTWKSGSCHLKRYCEEKEMWMDYAVPLLSGSSHSPWTSNAYWNHPFVDRDGTIFLSFCWRTDYLDSRQIVNNVNICFMKSFDSGLSWFSSNNRPLRLPITQVNADTIYAVSPESNLINQNSMAIDSQGNPHIVFYENDENSIPQYKHLWFDGDAWHCSVVSSRTAPFSLRGGGTLKIPMSRPEIVLDKQDNVFLIYRDDTTDNRLSVQLLKAPAYQFHEYERINIIDDNLENSEPVIDRERWDASQVLSILLQRNKQPNGDMEYEKFNMPISVIDVSFEILNNNF